MECEGRSNYAVVAFKVIAACFLGAVVWVTLMSLYMSATHPAETPADAFGVTLGVLFGPGLPVVFMLSVMAVAFAGYASYSARTVSANVQFGNREQFIVQATAALGRCGYRPEPSEVSALRFRLASPARTIYGAVSLYMSEGSARISGPRFCVKRVMDAVGAEVAES